MASASSRSTLRAATSVGIERYHDRSCRGRRCDVNVRRRDRFDPCHLDRPAHLAQSGIDGQACGSAAVRVPLVWFTLGVDLSRTSEFNRERHTTWLSRCRRDACEQQPNRCQDPTSRPVTTERGRRTRQTAMRRTDNTATPVSKEIPECSVTASELSGPGFGSKVRAFPGTHLYSSSRLGADHQPDPTRGRAVANQADKAGSKQEARWPGRAAARPGRGRTASGPDIERARWPELEAGDQLAPPRRRDTADLLDRQRLSSWAMWCTASVQVDGHRRCRREWQPLRQRGLNPDRQP